MPLAVNWRITDACNYRCSYCFAAESSYESNHCSLEQAEIAIKHLASANRPSYNVTLVGGEPTAHPYLADIVRLLGNVLGDRLERIIIVTNGNFDAETLDEIRSLASRVSIELVVSVHLEFARAEKIASLIEGLADSVRVRFSLMLHPDLLPRAQEMLDMFCKLRESYGFEMHVRTLREPPEFAEEDHRYTDEHRRWMEQARQEFEAAVSASDAASVYLPSNPCYSFYLDRKVDRKIKEECGLVMDELREATNFEFFGMTCCMGTDLISISPNGMARGAVCKLALYKYNIFNENPFLHDDWMQPVRCTMVRCGCDPNYCIPKFLSPKEADLYITQC